MPSLVFKKVFHWLMRMHFFEKHLHSLVHPEHLVLNLSPSVEGRGEIDNHGVPDGSDAWMSQVIISGLARKGQTLIEEAYVEALTNSAILNWDIN